jgi:signal transduction histidine kinase
VALAVKLSLVRQLAGEDPDLAGEMLDELRTDVQTTIRELRELAHGIYPPLLRDRGLGEALRTSAARSPLPCSVSVDLPGRYPEEVETAAYFCCLEAIQNAGKHAGEGAEITVRIGADGEGLWFRVSDDGAGFSLDSTAGHGFVNMQDRLGALGGRLSVESTPGSGSIIGGRLPAVPVQGAGVREPHGSSEPVSPAPQRDESLTS